MKIFGFNLGRNNDAPTSCVFKAGEAAPESFELAFGERAVLDAFSDDCAGLDGDVELRREHDLSLSLFYNGEPFGRLKLSGYEMGMVILRAPDDPFFFSGELDAYIAATNDWLAYIKSRVTAHTA